METRAKPRRTAGMVSCIFDASSARNMERPRFRSGRGGVWRVVSGGRGDLLKQCRCTENGKYFRVQLLVWFAVDQ